MYTPQQKLINDPEQLMANGTPIARASQNDSVSLLALIMRRKNRHFIYLVFFTPAVVFAVIAFRLHILTADVLRQECEGLGVALVAATYAGVLVWRVMRAMELEQQSLQTQPPVTNSSSRISSSEPNPANPQKNPSSIPPAAGAPALPAASFLVNLRT